MAVRKPISLKDNLAYYAEDEAEKFFQGNFSMFVGYLISCYREGRNFEKSKAAEITNNEEETNSALIDDIDSFFDEK
jgi:hypothetical protein